MKRLIKSRIKLAMHYVYVLQSEKDGFLYTGSISNLERRKTRHDKGWILATKHRRPLVLIYSEACIDRRDSIRRELYLKTNWGKAYIKSRLKYYIIKNGKSQLSGASHT